MKVLVCGGRQWRDRKVTKQVLDAVHRDVGITLLIEGGAAGADRLARLWAEDHGIEVREFPADWKRHGKSAGSIRNQQMITEGRPELVVAFPGGSGTTHMIQVALRAAIAVQSYWPGGKRYEPDPTRR